MILTKNDVERFKEILENLRSQLRQTIKSVSDEVKSVEEPKGYSQHQADEGTDDFGQTISIEISSEEQEIMRKVERALEKIEEGTFGICDVSGEEIPLARLEAIPYANMTVQAQEKFEKGAL